MTAMRRADERSVGTKTSNESDATAIVGRDREIATLARAIDDIEEHGSALLIRGDPGMGKTTLIDLVADRARDAGLAVVRAAGVQTEADLPFAGLHLLLRASGAHVDGTVSSGSSTTRSTFDAGGP